ncbi:hypothetical protein DFJ63DRAFT_332702 [Scheffersomyces coipomensis]|uniref:uncharacterized protein n=1 Tax=Scheffersomyces coipomensis TaxID=1788519 RepID=UPI00315CC05D
MAKKEEGNEELDQIWSLFQDSPEEIKERRKNITQVLQENTTQVFPTQMSIMSAADDLVACFSLGGQVKNYYRFGTYDMCQKQREKLWFAITHGTLLDSNDKNEDIEKLTAKELVARNDIQQYYKKRLLEDKAIGSSEDVWDQRKEPLSNPFKKV